VYLWFVIDWWYNKGGKKICLHKCRHKERVLEGAEKSLARPRRKQATAIKLRVYSTHSPRNSIHFLVRCSDFCKPLKKFRSLSVQLGVRSNNDLGVGRKYTYTRRVTRTRTPVAFILTLSVFIIVFPLLTFQFFSFSTTASSNPGWNSSSLFKNIRSVRISCLE